MSLFNRKKKSADNRPLWRMPDGTIKCTAFACNPSCELTCPIIKQTNGLNALRFENYETAIILFRQAVEIAPDFREAWNNLGSAYGYAGKHQEAYSCFLKAHELNKTNPNAIYGLILTSRDLNKYDECLQWCDLYAKVSSDGQERKIREQVKKLKDAHQALDSIDALCEKVVKSVIDSEQLSIEESDAFIDIPSLTEDIYQFCGKTYQETKRKVAEYYVTSFYAAFCLTIHHKMDENAFLPKDAFQFLSSKCDTEYCDVYVDKLFGWDSDSPEIDKLFSIFKPYLSFMMDILNPELDPQYQYVAAPMKGAVKIGIAAAAKYYGANMNRYFIENVRCDISGFGISCGRIVGHPVVTVKFRDAEKTQWLSLVEVEGIPNAFLLDKDLHDFIVKEDFENDELWEYLNENEIGEFNGIALGGDYSYTFKSIAADPDNPAVPLLRYIIAVIRCNVLDVDELIHMATGKFADALEIPISDMEADYLKE